MADYVYSGGPVLEVMAEARNYNAFLRDELLRHVAGAGRVLDFGAGTGLFAGWIAERGHDVACVEPDAENRRRLAAAGFAAVPDLAAVADASVDFAFSLNVLEHIADDVGALRLLHAKLRPRGGLFLYVPAFAVLHSAFDERVGHFRRYRRRDLAARVERAGFRVRRTEYVDCLGFAAALAYKALHRDGTLTAAAVVAYDRFAFPLSRALDPLFRSAFGKNVLLVAQRE